MRLDDLNTWQYETLRRIHASVIQRGTENSQSSFTDLLETHPGPVWAHVQLWLTHRILNSERCQTLGMNGCAVEPDISRG